MRGVREDYVSAARSMGAGSPQIARFVVLPAATASILSGVRLAIGFAWTTVVAAELNNGIPGIGGLAYISGTQLKTPLTIACIIVIGPRGRRPGRHHPVDRRPPGALARKGLSPMTPMHPMSPTPPTSAKAPKRSLSVLPTRRRSIALRLTAAALGLTLALSGCVTSGRTSHPDNFAGDVAGLWKPDPSITATARFGWQAIPNGDLVASRTSSCSRRACPRRTSPGSQMTPAATCFKAFGSESLDISLVGSSPAVKSASPPLSKDLKVIWISDVIEDAESLIVKDPDVEKLSDLTGKTIAVPFGSTAHYSLLTALEEEGLTGDVRVINLATDAILAAWQRDEIDAAWVWEPATLTQLVESGHPILSSKDSAGLGAPTFDLGRRHHLVPRGEPGLPEGCGPSRRPRAPAC